MSFFRAYASSSILGALAMVCWTGGNGVAGEYGGTRIAGDNRCAAYGPDFALVAGSDVCVRVGGHVRVQLGTNAGLNPSDGWRAANAAAATLRSESPGMMPTGTTSHLRVRGGLEYPDPFR